MATAVDAALKGLVAVFEAAPALEGVDVYDGPAVSNSKATAALSVGFAGERMNRTGAYPETEQPAVSVTSAPAGLGGGDLAEQYLVQNMLAVLDGGKDIVAARQRAYDLLGAAGDAVAADKTLSGAVAWARPGGHSLTQEQTPRGAVITIVFEVEIEAFTIRPGLGGPLRVR